MMIIKNHKSFIKMKRSVIIGLLLCSAWGLFAQDQSGRRNTIMPDTLAAMLTSGADSNMLILNTGPVDDILHAINIGAVSEAKNLKRLKKYLRKVDRDKAIVLYCGCCPFASCPNINPAYNLLTEMHFTNFKVLRLDDDLKMDWIDKGFPLSE